MRPPPSHQKGALLSQNYTFYVRYDSTILMFHWGVWRVGGVQTGLESSKNLDSRESLESPAVSRFNKMLNYRVDSFLAAGDNCRVVSSVTLGI
jgi:hypothetical protein